MCDGKSKKFAPVCMALSILAIVVSASAHEKHAHKAESKPQLRPDQAQQVIFNEINNEYLKSVKPIFQKSCFDCHSGTTNYPWYSKIPGPKQLIESDIKEALAHLDLSKDFPFAGHGTPLADLEAIRDSVKNGSMPPFRYRILHSSKTLSDADRKAILDWSDQSLNKFKATGASEP